MEKAELHILIVTGLSGAGKSTALNCLEDMGFYCIDNLPPTLLTKFLDIAQQLNEKIRRIALGMDIRSGDFFNDPEFYLQELKNRKLSYEIVYLEAAQEVLVHRYKESRRTHPLAYDGGLLEAICREQDMLQDIKGEASVVIDTSELKPKDIRERLYALYGGVSLGGSLNIGVMSFGYKAGIPMDADLVMDVRFLPNPFYIPELKTATGHHQGVIDYVLGFPVTQEFIAKFTDLLVFLLPAYIEEGKNSLLIAIGCTGGQHRSVVLANYLAAYLREKDYRVYVQHRELERRKKV